MVDVRATMGVSGPGVGSLGHREAATATQSTADRAIATEVARLRRVAHLLDSSIGIPGTRWRFGIDALIGLVPGIGDAGGAIVSGWFVHRARRLGIGPVTTARMVGNVLLDTFVGAIPLLGDLFDAAFRCNRRNLALLEHDLRRRGVHLPEARPA